MIDIGPRLAGTIIIVALIAGGLGLVALGALVRLVNSLGAYLTTARTHMRLNLNARTTDEMQAMLARMAQQANEVHKNKGN